MSWRLKVYCLLQHLLTTIIGLVFSLSIDQLGFQQQVGLLAFIMLSVFSVSAVMEHRHFAGVLEAMRLTMLFVMAILNPIPILLSLTLCCLCIISLPLLLTSRLEAHA